MVSRSPAVLFEIENPANMKSIGSKVCMVNTSLVVDNKNSQSSEIIFFLFFFSGFVHLLPDCFLSTVITHRETNHVFIPENTNSVASLPVQKA